MKNLGLIEWIAWILVIIGGINWLLIGLFRVDVVAMIFGEFTLLSRAVYILVGLSAVFLIYLKFKKTP